MSQLPKNYAQLKEHLFKKSIKHRQCEICNLSIWNQQPIPLQLHHVDGNKQNNTIENLQILCPNCHAQTPNFNSRNRKSKQAQKVSDEMILSIIPKCQSVSEVLKVLGLNYFGQGHVRVKRLIQKHNVKLAVRQLSESEIDRNLAQRRVIRPSREELSLLLWKKPASALAKELGVCDSSIVKWCRFYGIPKPPRGYWAKQKIGASGGGCNHTV